MHIYCLWIRSRQQHRAEVEYLNDWTGSLKVQCLFCLHLCKDIMLVSALPGFKRIIIEHPLRFGGFRWIFLACHRYLHWLVFTDFADFSNKTTVVWGVSFIENIPWSFVFWMRTRQLFIDIMVGGVNQDSDKLSSWTWLTQIEHLKGTPLFFFFFLENPPHPAV